MRYYYAEKIGIWSMVIAFTEKRVRDSMCKENRKYFKMSRKEVEKWRGKDFFISTGDRVDGGFLVLRKRTERNEMEEEKRQEEWEAWIN